MVMNKTLINANMHSNAHTFKIDFVFPNAIVLKKKNTFEKFQTQTIMDIIMHNLPGHHN